MSTPTPIHVDCRALDRVMPMHLIVDSMSHIRHAGPTINKILGGEIHGRSVFSLFELRRPRKVRTIDDVRALVGAKIHLRLRDSFETPMVASVVVLPVEDQVLINLSFGYAVVEAVARYKLTGSDFAPTDLAIEMLYLVEAKTAAMEATSQLAHRLHGEKTEAQIDALTDGLTGLRNRRSLDNSLERHIARSQPFSLMHLDLDFFKAVNDTMGHAAGDAVLCEVARVLKTETRSSDTVARVGGDEFVILFSGLTDVRQLGKIAGRIISKIEEPIPYKGQSCNVSASIGIARSTDYNSVRSEALAEDADIALYASKRKGRARYSLYHPDMKKTAARKQA